MNSNIQKAKKDLEKWFFWFWVRRFRVSYLFIFLILVSWIFSMISIPKESSPDIKFWIIWINTIYPWVNPNDMDSLITEKIEKEIDDIDWINKIISVSWIGISNITVELKNSANTRNVLTDIKDQVDKVNLPEDAENPIVTELSTSSDLMFEVLLYWDPEKYSQFDLIQKAQYIKNNLEWNISWLSSINVWSLNLNTWQANSSSDYEILVLLDKEKLDTIWLNISEISSTIRSYNKNTPIGNYEIWNLNYDFRFDWELNNIEELKKLVVKSTQSSNVLLEDIAVIKKEYKTDNINKLWFQNNTWYNYTSLLFNKTEWLNVFEVSWVAKQKLENFMSSDNNLKWIDIFYVNDLSQVIIEDYKNLSTTAIQTLFFVFIIILVFVWLKESLIASILIPLSFMVTFVVLYILGYTLNFLTNFSLVLTLWIAIDTVIVIIEWASEKMKLWYSRKTSILLSIRDFKTPLISGTLTTLVVFLPLMFLPWVMWKFLAYIPITVFITLLATLTLSLTISSPLFLKFARSSKKYSIDEKLESTFSPLQKEFLEFERQWKELEHDSKISIRDKYVRKLGLSYYYSLKKVITTNYLRRLIIIAPIFILIFTFVFISPKIGFTLFPESDNWVIQATVETREWTDEEVLVEYLDVIDDAISIYDELKVYNVTISWNKIDIFIELLSKNERDALWLKNVFEIEEDIISKLKELEKEWLSVSIKTASNWPPSWKAIWVKLVADNTKKIDQLKEVAYEFRDYFKTIDWLKNISTTSSESPWQFIFEFDKNKLSQLWLTPNDILNQVYLYTNWTKAWSIKSEYEDNDIKLLIEQFENNLGPDEVLNLIINTKSWKIRVWDVADYKFTNAITSITREDWNITISVEADLENNYLTTDIQPIIDEYTNSYNFPEWINSQKWWENQENAELIEAVVISLFISLFLIFSILVFQFNSFRQPLIVLYSVILAIIWVNIWLYATGNPYSITFMIWFIAMTWVVVNNAIILIDRINRNLDKGIDNVHSVIWAWKSRLQPILVTTITTVFWVLPLALQDEFWAWLWFTIVFWLLAWSVMTLFVIPSLYYSWFLMPKKNNKKKYDLEK